MDTRTLRQLDIFAQMVASGSVTRCASELGVSRAAITRELRQLESRIGHRLFESMGDNARLTTAGRHMIAAMRLLSATDVDHWDEVHAPPPEGGDGAEGMARAMPEARRPQAADPAPPMASAASLPPKRKVTIAAHPAIFSHFQEALDAFEQANGDVAISLELGALTVADAAALLVEGRADIAYFHALGEGDDLGSRYGWSEQISVFVGVDHALAGADQVPPDDLSAIAPLLLAPSNSLRDIVGRALAMAGVAVTDPVLESDNLYEIMMAVRAGAGYFAAFGSLARDFGRMSGIRRLPVSPPLPPVEIRQAVRPAMRTDPVVAALAEYLFR
jgi:DNA-binding transcriptional LysR family regulator